MKGMDNPSRCAVCDILIYQSRDDAAACDAALGDEVDRRHVLFIPHLNGAVGDRCILCAADFEYPLSGAVVRRLEKLFGGMYQVRTRRNEEYG